jgi:ABC-type glycerol-3-phosphate transport system substrate-binding protein
MSFYNQIMKRLLLAPVLLLLLLLAACAPASTPAIEPTATPTPALPIAPATPEIPTLTLWLPDWMALPDAAGSDSLHEIISAFEEEKGVQVVIIPKLPRGEGGLLDALRTTKPVAPSVLPDIIALPFQDIPTATQEDLLQPLNDQFSADILDDLYPFARQASQTEDAWMAVPFAADFEHLSFQPAALSDPPVNWDIILSSKSQYAFPVGGTDSVWTDALLLHYLSAVPEGETPDRNKEALQRQLRFYETLYRQGQVDESVLQINTPAGSWEQALQGAAILAETTANLWLGQRGEATFLRFGPTPTSDSQARYLMHGWAYAIITADETHQALAIDLISRLVEAQALSDWSSQAHVLPARRSSLQQWPQDDYRDFANEALEKGFLMPDFTGDEAMTRSVHQAARAVLSGEMTADEAWQQAVSGW